MQSGSKKVLQHLFMQKRNGTFCDVQLHLQGTILWGHACILASCSPYFMDYLNKESSEGNHWCAIKPLVIALDKIVDDGKAVCFICVSKIIDFMYLRELIVLKGHFQHFCEIVNLLKILDLLPFCKNSYRKTYSSNFSKNNAVSDNINNNLGLTNCLERNQVDCNITIESSHVIVDTCHMNKSTDNGKSNIYVDLGDVNGQCKNEETKTINVLEVTSLKTKECKASSYISVQNENVIMNNVSSQVNYENMKVRSPIKNCEFPCCNTNLSSGSEGRQHKKRTMSCESCQYLSVSIKKMLKHVQTTNHVKSLCPICNLSVENVKDINQHLKDHYNAKPFICHICQKRNRFWEYHKKHLRVHCRNKPFYCEICQKRFKYKQNLTIHILTHNYKHVCNECGYLASDESTHQAHQLQHGNEQSPVGSDIQQAIKEKNILSKHPVDHKQNKFQTLKKFQCCICNKRFTQQKNLARHIEVVHNSNKEFKCPMCTYLTKRYDSIRDHMKKHHNCLPDESLKMRKRRVNSKAKKKQECPHQDGIVGVLIPVQLVSVDGSSTFDAFAVKARSNEIPKDEENIQLKNLNSEEIVNTCSATNNSLFQSQKNSGTIDSFHSPKIGSYEHFINEPKLTRHVEVSKSTNSEESQKINVKKENDWNCNATEIESHFMEQSENIWLNEATGELLNCRSSVSVPNIDAEYSVVEKNCMDIKTRYSSLLSSDFKDHLQSLILNETIGNPSFDLDDDRQSNAQTPQTNLLDSQDNLFPWESLSDNFCSTWILNETTGELNMVSFNMQPLKLDEQTGTFSLMDDDETAPFLNEGTGDLSVIYFNPTKNSCDTSNYFVNDKLNQEKLETMSQHSNDEDDLLNEEFLRASADFMAQDENKTFLNELTGEFDVTHYNSFHSETHQVLGNESIYLNEQTGEISWNTVDKSMNNEISPNTDSLRFDFDDSLNCEDFEQFSTEINDFSSQFCLDNHNTNNWHNFDETCDILLNERTGEFIKKC